VAFVAFAIWSLWLSRRRRMSAVFLALFLAVVGWWISIAPSHDRPWRPEVAVMPRVFIDGDRVRITGVRNFDYRTRNDFIVRHEERELQLSHLTGLDFYVSYWSEGLVGHTFLSFIFDNAPPLSISIETRPEVGEGFAPIASMFKQFELIYVVGDERALIGSAMLDDYHRIFLYRTTMSTPRARALFLRYAHKLNALAAQPEWYNAIMDNCTTGIYMHLRQIPPTVPFSLSILVNGYLPQHAYEQGTLDTSLPFDELQRRCDIKQVGREAYRSADFSRLIRRDLPTPPQAGKQ
jgi:Domain of unknown function (DUF4105)